MTETLPCPPTTSRTPRSRRSSFPTSGQAARHVALMIESLIRQNNSAGRPTVLGLPTGSTPVGLYRELIRLHKEAGLDFSRVVTFNLDEYFPMPPDDPHSYRRWMQETFFNHVNIPPQNIHIPDGTIRPEDVEDYCAALRAEDPPGRRHRPADPRHRPHRPHRLQRARLDAPQPHAPGHARSGDAPRRGQQLLRRGERAAPGADDGRRHHPRSPQDRAAWPSASTRRRSCSRPSKGDDDRRRRRQLPAEAPRRHLPARPGRRRRADRHRAGPGASARSTGRRP